MLILKGFIMSLGGVKCINGLRMDHGKLLNKGRHLTLLILLERGDNRRKSDRKLIRSHRSITITNLEGWMANIHMDCFIFIVLENILVRIPLFILGIVNTKGVYQVIIGHFNMTIYLWMKSNKKSEDDTLLTTKSYPKGIEEAWIFVRHNVERKAKMRWLLSWSGLGTRNEHGHFGETTPPRRCNHTS